MTYEQALEQFGLNPDIEELFMTKDEALDLALEALEWIANRCPEQMLKQPLHTIHQEAVYDAGACARAAIAAAKVKA
jgi:hypothetical protein